MFAYYIYENFENNENKILYFLEIIKCSEKVFQVNWTKEKIHAALSKIDDPLANGMTNSATQAANKAIYATCWKAPFEN